MFKPIIAAVRRFFSQRPPSGATPPPAAPHRVGDSPTWLDRIKAERKEQERRRKLLRRLKSRSLSRAYPARPKRIAAYVALHPELHRGGAL